MSMEGIGREHSDAGEVPGGERGRNPIFEALKERYESFILGTSSEITPPNDDVPNPDGSVQNREVTSFGDPLGDLRRKMRVNMADIGEPEKYYVPEQPTGLRALFRKEVGGTGMGTPAEYGVVDGTDMRYDGPGGEAYDDVTDSAPGYTDVTETGYTEADPGYDDVTDSDPGYVDVTDVMPGSQEGPTEVPAAPVAPPPDTVRAKKGDRSIQIGNLEAPTIKDLEGGLPPGVEIGTINGEAADAYIARHSDMGGDGGAEMPDSDAEVSGVPEATDAPDGEAFEAPDGTGEPSVDPEQYTDTGVDSSESTEGPAAERAEVFDILPKPDEAPADGVPEGVEEGVADAAAGTTVTVEVADVLPDVSGAESTPETAEQTTEQEPEQTELSEAERLEIQQPTAEQSSEQANEQPADAYVDVSEADTVPEGTTAESSEQSDETSEAADAAAAMADAEIATGQTDKATESAEASNEVEAPDAAGTEIPTGDAPEAETAPEADDSPAPEDNVEARDSAGDSPQEEQQKSPESDTDAPTETDPPVKEGRVKEGREVVPAGDTPEVTEEPQDVEEVKPEAGPDAEEVLEGEEVEEVEEDEGVVVTALGTAASGLIRQVKGSPVMGNTGVAVDPETGAVYAVGSEANESIINPETGETFGVNEQGELVTLGDVREGTAERSRQMMEDAAAAGLAAGGASAAIPGAAPSQLGSMASEMGRVAELAAQGQTASRGLFGGPGNMWLLGRNEGPVTRVLKGLPLGVLGVLSTPMHVLEAVVTKNKVQGVEVKPRPEGGIHVFDGPADMETFVVSYHNGSRAAKIEVTAKSPDEARQMVEGRGLPTWTRLRAAMKLK